MKQDDAQPSAGAMDRFIDEREASRISGLKVRYLQKQRFFGKGPRAYRVGRLIRYRASDLEEFLTREIAVQGEGR